MFQIIRRMLISRKIRFFAFAADYFNHNGVIVTSYSTDFGSRFRDIPVIKKWLDKIDAAPAAHSALLPIPAKPDITFVIDVPPETLPAKYLGRFRSPAYLSHEIISFFHGVKHQTILLVNGTTLAIEPWQHGLQKRCAQSEETAIPQNAVVLTYASSRYFYFKNKGLRTIPLGRCFVSAACRFRRNDFAAVVSSNPDQHKISLLEQFMQEWLVLSPRNNALSRCLPKMFSGELIFE